ncbi:MAG: hypothetical protein ACKV19_21755 [Verrucomicrobiales bacterium]
MNDRPDRRRVRSLWAKLALVIIPTGLVLGGLEAAARLYVWKRYGHQNHGMNWRFHYEPYILTRTDDRLADPVPPDDGSFRVLVIGGSTAALLPSGALEEALSPVVGRRVVVINRAQGGYILNQERLTLLLHGLRTRPDLLLTLDGANDIVTASKTQRPGIAYANDFVALGVERPVLNGALGLIRDSQFINCLNKLRERGIEGTAQTDEALLTRTMDHCEEALHSMAIIAKGLDIPHYMVLQPYLHLKANLSPDERAVADAYAYRGDYMSKGFRALRERLAQSPLPPNARFVDATRAFDSTPDVCFIDEVHLTEAGNRALVSFIAQAVAAGQSGEAL